MAAWRTLVVLALLGGLFFLPEGNTGRLAARQSHVLLSIVPGGHEESLGTIALNGPHGYERGDDEMRFALAGVRLVGLDLDDLRVHYELRKSIVQGLRAQAAGLKRPDGGTGYSLVIPGERMPVVQGASFLGGVRDGAVRSS